MSTPPQSMNSKIPTWAYRKPMPALNARSTSSGVDALLDEAHGLVHEERLHPRPDEAGRVGAAHHHLAQPLEELDGTGDDRTVGRPAGDDLDERNDVGRVEPVRHEEALRTLHGVGEVLRRDRRARRGDDRPGADTRREPAEDVALELEQLRQRLLDEAARAEAVEAHA